MSYSWALLSRWSTRDRLAVLVIAVTAAFLVGAVVVLLAVSGQTTMMAGEHGADVAVSLATVGNSALGEGSMPATAVEGGTAFPLATATVDGEERTVVGVPPDNGYGIGPTDGAAGPPAGTTVTLVGEEATVTRTLTPPVDGTPFPDRWIVTDASTARDLGSDRALVFREPTTSVPAEGAPLTGALAFFLIGTRQMLGVLGVVCAGVAVLVGVVVFSVTRMTVRDRRSTLAVLRATGASARRVGALIAARAGLLTLCGVALGYAVGVIVPNAAATVAVAFGLPVALPLNLDGTAVTLVAVILAGLVVVGVLAGALAARSVVRGAPLDRPDGGAWDPPGGPSFLPAETVVPTLSTLSVFVAFVLVVAALGGVLGGVGAGADSDSVSAGGGSSGTIVEPGSVHPVDSHVPVAYAEAFRRTGAAASPEILLFLVHDGRALPARGVDFDAYRSVSDARLVAGRAPNATDEAVVGADLSRTLGVGPGDELAVGGSTTPAAGTVDIVGTFEASGAADDHLLVSLPLARHLEDVPEGTANLVRYREGVDTAANDSVVVLGLSAPQQAATGESFTARVGVQNVGSDRATRTVRASFGDQQRRTRVTLDGGERRTVELPFEATGTGARNVVVGDRTWTVRVLSPETLVLAPLPERGPTNGTLHVRVGTVAGGSVDDATVSVGDRTVRTDGDGRARLRLPETAGRYAVAVTAGERSASHEIDVRAETPRDPAVRVVTPDETGVYAAPTVLVRVRNAWDRELERTVRLDGPGLNRSRTVRLSPGDGEAVTATLARRPPGTYQVRATAGAAEATGEYRVSGDDRLASAVASSGRTSGGVGAGAGGLVSRAFGNVALVLATLVGLGMLMTVGSTVAAFADAVQARRRDVGIYRAVGATPAQVARLVLGDAVRIGLPAAIGSLVVAGAALTVLSATGTLTVFGVRLAPSVPLEIAPLLAVGAFALSLVSAGVVAWQYCSVDPSELFGGGR